MQPFVKLESIAAPLARINVDTDQIIPKQFMKTISRKGLGKSLFYDLRYDQAGNERIDFILTQPQFRSAQILLCGANFGCGSSREHAVWAIHDFGYRVLIGSSFADIFYNNSLKNNLLLVTLDSAVVDAMMQASHQEPAAKLTVDLEQQTIIDHRQQSHTFNFDPTDKQRLLQGWDDIAMTMQEEREIANHEAKIHSQQAWRNISS